MKTEQPVRVTTLCYRCRCDYISAGYLLTFVGNTIKSECDIIIGGHIHQPKVVAVAQELHSGKIKTTYAVTGKAWLKDESYSISAAYEPVSDIQPVIHLGSGISIIQ